MDEKQIQIWDLWYPKAAATGLPFARCLIDPQDSVLVHSVPPHVTVKVSDQEGKVIAQANDLSHTAETPMTRLKVTNGSIQREDIWPGQEDIGKVVLLPGGEAGRLLEWWNADDHSEWRWKVEFYNHR